MPHGGSSLGAKIVNAQVQRYRQPRLRRLKLLVTFFLALVVLTTSTSFSQVAPATQVATARNDGWKTATADSAGVDSNQLLNLTKAIRAWPELGVHAILIERNGRLIYEEYFDGFDERWGIPLGRVTMTAESKHDLRSVTKSVVSALLGIAHGEGTIPSLDQPLIHWFPDYPELDTPKYRRVTLAHALSMTSGFKWNEMCLTTIRATMKFK